MPSLWDYMIIMMLTSVDDDNMLRECQLVLHINIWMLNVRDAHQVYDEIPKWDSSREMHIICFTIVMWLWIMMLHIIFSAIGPHLMHLIAW